MALQERWFEPRIAAGLLPLVPLSALFAVLAAARRLAYRRGWLATRRLPVSVVVVGNLIVGGAGKTPLTLALVRELAQRGLHPGIVSRGYRGGATAPLQVRPDGDAALVGDEPLLLARRAPCPVWVGRDRAAAGAALLAEHPEVDVVVCDDGLQHYRLARDVELAVFDGRGAGNGWLLPAGPLREPLVRLKGVDAVVFNGACDPGVDRRAPRSFSMSLQPGPFHRLHDMAQTCSAEALRGRRLHAVAGIGHPQRFFRTLADLGLDVAPRPFPDHHRFCREDLAIPPGDVLLLTEKDAVKCPPDLAGEAWVLPVEAGIPPGLVDLIVEKIRGRKAS
ncbi:MAG: tetraacyldisaccharide 4'-kinase [Azonexus sp.]|nr:tetraacyldisaccharide 4'-kinase [Betaproteobacteria bacterium]MBK8918757.1 tetraacyldisaccharide 4'-kinase [Betaproteobacteria bacterium]MBP6034690.1 tetraacyldisaccharide 4'-kinase [Azonexus sp.]MBP6905230.1 tetraacyldisaccharide 4'-kinase [Azonexus sp.]